MEPVAAIAARAQAQIESKQPTPSLSTQPSTVISKLWRRMQHIYGHKWESAHGLTDKENTWAIGLADMTVEEIGIGLNECVHRADPWPPSLPEFRALCRPPKVKRENAAAYHYPGPSLPHLLSDERRAAGRAAVEVAKAALRGTRA